MSSDLIYASMGSKQGFFTISSGKYVPVTKKFFKRWKKKKIAWWYLFAVDTTDNLIETYGTRAWNKAMTPDEHFKRTREELGDILRSRNDIVNYLHVMAYPFSEELSGESINRIFKILQSAQS